MQPHTVMTNCASSPNNRLRNHLRHILIPPKKTRLYQRQPSLHRPYQRNPCRRPRPREFFLLLRFLRLLLHSASSPSPPPLLQEGIHSQDDRPFGEFNHPTQPKSTPPKRNSLHQPTPHPPHRPSHHPALFLSLCTDPILQPKYPFLPSSPFRTHRTQRVLRRLQHAHPSTLDRPTITRTATGTGSTPFARIRNTGSSGPRLFPRRGLSVAE